MLIRLRSPLLLLSTLIADAAVGVGAQELDDDVFATEANVFYDDWASHAWIARSASDVRETPDATISMTDPSYVSSFIDWLALEELRPSGGIREFEGNKDVKLVVDISFSNGASETYVSDGHWLYNEDESMMKPVDASFLCKFHFNSWNSIADRLEKGEPVCE